MAKFPVVLPLPGLLPAPEHPSPALPPAAQVNPQYPHQLWLALVFPQLGLEVYLGEQRDIAAALVKTHKGRSLVHSVSRAARAQGVHIDMPLNAAYALSPGLKVYTFDEPAQNHRLQQLAVWAEQFTSKVSVKSPSALLLEVRGSIKLFGGLAALQQHIHQQLCDQWHHRFLSAITPTPLASLLLARSGRCEVITDKTALRSVLGPLSIRYLPIGFKKKRQLHNTGVRVLRDLFRLPRQALARRFGAELTHYLDRILGLVPDPLNFFTSGERFEAYFEFPLEVRKTDVILPVAGQLLEQLALFLRKRDICVNQYEFRLQHGKRSATTLVVGMRQPSRDSQHLLSLLTEQLQRCALKAAVSSVLLSAREFLPFMPLDDSLGLFTDIGSESSMSIGKTDINRLLEQLQSRLGCHAIQVLHGVNDHRPEHAYRVGDKPQQQYQELQRQRPMWLLPEPLLLAQRDNRPWLNGPVKLLKGPERIEAGWWSGKDIRRDYYIAIDGHGSQLWVFQTLNAQHQWYLHGVFS